MSNYFFLNYQEKSVNFASPKIWTLLQIAILVLPIIPALGTILIFITTIWTGIKYTKIACQSILNKLLAILTLWLIFTAFLAPYPSEAFLGLANYLPFFLAFSSIHLLFNNPSQLRQIAWLIVISSFFVVILGLGQLFLNWHIPYILGWELVTGGEPKGRMSSVFIYANFLAIYLQIVFIFALGLIIEFYQNLRNKKPVFKTLFDPNFPFLFTQRIKNNSNNSVPPYQNVSEQLIFKLNSYQNQVFVFLILTLILTSIGLILTSSRNSWLISFIAVIAFLLYLGWHKIILALGTMILTIIWSAIGPDPVKIGLRKIIPISIWGRLSDEIYPDRTVESLRITQWKFTIELIKEHPLTGWGLRNFTPLYEEKWGLWLGHPHNLFLMFTAETGFIGMILLGSFVGLILYKNILLLKELSIKHQDHLIIFTYLIAFGSCILFNLFDVSLFDLRVNILTWILLFALGGITKFFKSKVGFFS